MARYSGVVKNHELMAEFRRLAGRRRGLPTSEWMLEIGTFLMRTETELILKSRWAKPKRLLDAGFEFRWPELRAAMSSFQTRDGIKSAAENFPES